MGLVCILRKLGLSTISSFLETAITIGVIIKLTIIETPMSVKVYISSPTLHGIFLHSSFNNGKIIRNICCLIHSQSNDFSTLVEYKTTHKTQLYINYFYYVSVANIFILH